MAPVLAANSSHSNQYDSSNSSSNSNIVLVLVIILILVIVMEVKVTEKKMEATIVYCDTLSRKPSRWPHCLECFKIIPGRYTGLLLRSSIKLP